MRNPFVKPKVTCRDCRDQIPLKDALNSLTGKDGTYQCKSCYLAEPLTEMFDILAEQRAVQR